MSTKGVSGSSPPSFPESEKFDGTNYLEWSEEDHDGVQGPRGKRLPNGNNSVPAICVRRRNRHFSGGVRTCSGRKITVAHIGHSVGRPALPLGTNGTHATPGASW